MQDGFLIYPPIPEDPNSINEVPGYFYANIDPEDAQQQGLTVDAGTVKWWMRQSKEASSYLEVNQRPLQDVLHDLYYFCLKTAHEARASAPQFLHNGKPIEVQDIKYLRVWGHGADFDPVLLQQAFRLFKGSEISRPWGHRMARDTRTVFDQVWPQLGGQYPHNTLLPGTNHLRHIAWVDAWRQAHAVCCAYHQLGLTNQECPCDRQADCLDVNEESHGNTNNQT